MPEIFKFPIPEAYAERNANGGITVSLVYPDEDQRAYSSERRLSNADAVAFGIDCLTRLNKGEQAAIGTYLRPSRPASGGIIDLFSDGSFLTHRRDTGTKVHPLYNGIPSGFPACEEHFEDISLLQRTEGAEESILFEKNGNGIYVPKDDVSNRVTRNRLKLLGLENKVIPAEVEYLAGPDVLEIYNDQDELISKTEGCIYLSWEIETNVAIAAVRYWKDIDPRKVAAIDAEGFMREGRFVHLGREKFHMTQEQVRDVSFGQEIPMPKRYQLARNGSLGYAKEVPAQEGEVYRFMPDDGLRRMLDHLEISGWKGNWINHEIAEAEKQYAILTGKQ